MGSGADDGTDRAAAAAVTRQEIVSWPRDVDLNNVHERKTEIDGLLDRDGVDTLVIDLAQLDFIDSLGIGVLIHARDRCPTVGVDLVLRHVPDRTMRLLAAAGLATLFTVEP